ncbi:MAG: hypothetical protein ACOCZ5_00445 [bacterium]
MATTYKKLYKENPDNDIIPLFYKELTKDKVIHIGVERNTKRFIGGININF